MFQGVESCPTCSPARTHLVANSPCERLPPILGTTYCALFQQRKATQIALFFNSIQSSIWSRTFTAAKTRNLCSKNSRVLLLFSEIFS